MINIDELLNHGENINVEFKRSKNSLSKDIWETYSAFANTSGGYIVLGVKETQEHEYEIEGVLDPEKIVDDLYNTAANRDKVSRNILDNNSVEVICKNGKNIVVVCINELPINQKPLYLNKKFSNAYVRKNSGDYLADDEDLKRFSRNVIDNIDAELLNNYTLEDLDDETVLLFKEFAHKRKPEARFLEMDNFTFLKEMGVFRVDRQDNRKYKLTLAGLIFLGTEEAITSRLPHFHLDYLDKRGNVERWRDRVSSGDLDYANLNVLKFYRIVRDKIFSTIEEPFDLDDRAVRKSKSELQIVLREALVNMLMHADYLDKEFPIRCEVHDLYYLFTNPGTMKIPKDLFFVGNYSSARNDVLMSFFKKIGAAEKEGGGGKEIYSITAKNNFREPELEVTLKKTYLKIWIAVPSETYEKFSDDTKAVLKVIHLNVVSKMKDIEKATGLTNYAVRKAIKDLLDKKLIEISGKGKSTVYIWKTSKLEHIANLEKVKDFLVHFDK